MNEMWSYYVAIKSALLILLVVKYRCYEWMCNLRVQSGKRRSPNDT